MDCPHAHTTHGRNMPPDVTFVALDKLPFVRVLAIILSLFPLQSFLLSPFDPRVHLATRQIYILNNIIAQVPIYSKKDHQLSGQHSK